MHIRLTSSPGEVRIALLEGDSLIDAALWRPGNPDGWGDVHLVRITYTAPALGGAFVKTADGQEGFLTTRNKVLEGSLLTAQIIRSAQNHKGPRFKPIQYSVKQITPQAPQLLSHGPTPLEEIAERVPHAPIIVDDMQLAARLPQNLYHRIQRESISFDSILSSEWDDLISPTQQVGPLKAHITPTASLTAIDLDSTDRPDFKSNLECFPYLLRSIRLRNLSGTILIDPAGIKSRKRPALIPFLKNALEKENDPLTPRVTGITPSGLLELTRPRRRAPLHELIASPHGKAISILRHLLQEQRSEQTLHAPPEIIRALEKDVRALSDYALITGHSLSLRPFSDSPPPFWKMS